MKKPKKLNINEMRLNVRKHWEINPVTRIVPKKKRKSRKTLKQDFAKELREE